MADNRYYSIPGPMGILAFQFIAELMLDPTLDLNEPMVDNYLFEVGFGMDWDMAKTASVVTWLKLRNMLV